jgi:hypothetical protein
VCTIDGDHLLPVRVGVAPLDTTAYRSTARVPLWPSLAPATLRRSAFEMPRRAPWVNPRMPAVTVSLLFVSTALADYRIGLEEVAVGIWSIWFGETSPGGSRGLWR